MIDIELVRNGIKKRYTPIIDNIEDLVKVENFEKAYDDDFKGWHLHHRYGVKYNREWLLTHDCYYNRPYYELIFLTAFEHRSLHNKTTSFRDKNLNQTVNEKLRSNFKEMTGLKPEENPFFFKNWSKKHRRMLRNRLKPEMDR